MKSSLMREQNVFPRTGLKRKHSLPEEYVGTARICFVVGNISDLRGYDRAQQNGVKQYFDEGKPGFHSCWAWC